MSILFHIESLELEFQDQDVLEALVLDVVENEGFKPDDINVILCDDEYLLNMNNEFLEHDFYTDIITFDYSDDQFVSGDLFISYQRVCDNASTFEVATELELRRVVAHGILHLVGFKDKSEEDEKEMRAKEDFYLSRI